MKSVLRILNPEADRNTSRNHSEIDQHPVICNFVSILLLPWSSRVVPKCKNGPPRCSRDAKMTPQGAPEMPKWLPECQKGGCAKVAPKTIPNHRNNAGKVPLEARSVQNLEKLARTTPKRRRKGTEKALWPRRVAKKVVKRSPKSLKIGLLEFSCSRFNFDILFIEFGSHLCQK